MSRKTIVVAAAALAATAGAAALGYRQLVVLGYVKYNQWDRRVRGGPGTGAAAPDLALARYEGGTLALASLWRERPLFLVFGSCT